MECIHLSLWPLYIRFIWWFIHVWVISVELNQHLCYQLWTHKLRTGGSIGSALTKQIAKWLALIGVTLPNANQGAYSVTPFYSSQRISTNHQPENGFHKGTGFQVFAITEGQEALLTSAAFHSVQGNFQTLLTCLNCCERGKLHSRPSLCHSAAKSHIRNYLHCTGCKHAKCTFPLT